MRKILILLALLIQQSAESQIFVANGAIVKVNIGAVVQSNGGFSLSSSTNFTNEGTITISKNSTLPLPGTISIRSSSVVNGNGNYRIEQDWINDATFIADNSNVEFFGNTQQFITSNIGISTTFHDVVLTGSGSGINRKKTLQLVNSSINSTGNLKINDRELETQVNTFFILNSSSLSVTNTTTVGSEGFVSSTFPGTFSRVTDSMNIYIFPTGSSNGTIRYRPIEISPLSIASNTFEVRFNNYDSNVDGFNRLSNDGNMCALNDKYYHSIDRTSGSSASSIKMFYISALDGNWDGTAHWKNTSSDWNDMISAPTGLSGVFNTITKNTWNFIDPGHPYILSELRPIKPTINCPLLCENTNSNTFSLTGNSMNYQWSVPSVGSIVSGQGTDTALVNWTTGSGYVYVYAVGSAGCNSIPDSCFITPLPAPIAYFSTTSIGDYGDNYQFSDSSIGASSWLWDFGDGSISTSQNPNYQYNGAGTYTAILTASNGVCSDTALMMITTSEGIVIPNIFTPNGDGINDEYFITSSGLTEFDLKIFNRWGTLLFATVDKNKKWSGDGHSDGTYFFLLKAKSSTKDYSTHGTVTIAGSK